MTKMRQLTAGRTQLPQCHACFTSLHRGSRGYPKPNRVANINLHTSITRFHNLRTNKSCYASTTDSIHAAEAKSMQLPSSIANICADLPIKEVIMDVLHALDNNNGAVLQAPPGAGKTSTVPLALLAHQPAYLEADTTNNGSNGTKASRGKTILVLEPRRVAAKAAARRMAALLGEKVGMTVGYRVRLETRVSSATSIEVVTEGVLLRRLQHDPELSGVGAVLFDEFHERNLDADTALALTLDLQAVARPDLRLLVMSATLGGGLAERCAALLTSQQDAGSAAAPIITSEGRSYPVRLSYLGAPSRERDGLEKATTEAVIRALQSQANKSTPAGDVLVFLPGVAEIMNTERLLLQQMPGSWDVDVVQLHGSMAPRDQDDVVSWKPKPSGPRRVILATPIAESSLTLNGVVAVVDSGLRRSPVFDAATGVNRLQTVHISAASAEQRSGRAGRLGPGVAYRLWSQQDILQGTTPPEIEEADLAPLALQLACWGVPVTQQGAAATSLPWLDEPPATRLADAVQLLQELGAVNDKGQVTKEGREMARMGVHPRLAAMVQRGAALGAKELAILMASLLSERDILRGRGIRTTASLLLRLGVLAQLAGGEPTHIAGVETLVASSGPIETVLASTDMAGAKRVLLGALNIANSLQAQIADRGVDGSETEAGSDTQLDERDTEEMAGTDTELDDERATGQVRGGVKHLDTCWHSTWMQQARREGLAGALVALAYPDRLAVRASRSNARAAFTLSGGANVRLMNEDDPLGQGAELLAIAELGGTRAGSSSHNDAVVLAAPLSRTAVDRYLKQFITDRDVVFWASASKAVLGRRQRRLGRLVLEERSIPVTDELALPALLQGFKEMGGIKNLGLHKDLEAWRQRALWLRATDLATSSPPSSSLPDISDEALLTSAGVWLAPYLLGVRSKSDLQKLNWSNILKGMVSHEDRSRIEREVPGYVLLPTGTKARIDYSKDPPIASCKIQEVFGLAQTPRVAGDRVPVALELLSPSNRPLQITRDLANFWRGQYEAVRKEQKGKYPKHYWPDDPLQAEATKQTKKAMDAAAANKNSQAQASNAATSTAQKAGKRKSK